jgi:hypothetical protein
MKTAKAVVAAIGATATAVMTAVATAQVVLDDGALDAGEYGTLTTAAITLAVTVWAVWRVPNKDTETETLVRNVHNR